MLIKFSSLIKASHFFPRYAKKVVQYHRKVQGKTSRGETLKLTEEDKEHMCKGVDRMAEDLKTEIRKQ